MFVYSFLNNHFWSISSFKNPICYKCFTGRINILLQHFLVFIASDRRRPTTLIKRQNLYFRVNLSIQYRSINQIFFTSLRNLLWYWIEIEPYYIRYFTFSLSIYCECVTRQERNFLPRRILCRKTMCDFVYIYTECEYRIRFLNTRVRNDIPEARYKFALSPLTGLISFIKLILLFYPFWVRYFEFVGRTQLCI